MVIQTRTGFPRLKHLRRLRIDPFGLLLPNLRVASSPLRISRRRRFKKKRKSWFYYPLARYQKRLKRQTNTLILKGGFTIPPNTNPNTHLPVRYHIHRIITQAASTLTNIKKKERQNKITLRAAYSFSRIIDGWITGYRVLNAKKPWYIRRMRFRHQKKIKRAKRKIRAVVRYYPKRKRLLKASHSIVVDFLKKVVKSKWESIGKAEPTTIFKGGITPILRRAHTLHTLFPLRNLILPPTKVYPSPTLWRYRRHRRKFKSLSFPFPRKYYRRMVRHTIQQRYVRRCSTPVRLIPFVLRRERRRSMRRKTKTTNQLIKRLRIHLYKTFHVNKPIPKILKTPRKKRSTKKRTGIIRKKLSEEVQNIGYALNKLQCLPPEQLKRRKKKVLTPPPFPILKLANGTRIKIL